MLVIIFKKKRSGTLSLSNCLDSQSKPTRACNLYKCYHKNTYNKMTQGIETLEHQIYIGWMLPNLHGQFT